MSALSRHAINFYKLLEEDAKLESLAGLEVLVYRGPVSKLWHQTGASNAYYSRVMNSLHDMGCIAMIQRGSVNVLSAIAVLRPPKAEDFDAVDLTPAADPATMRQELENVKRNIGGIDIAQVVIEFDARIKELENLVREVIQNGKESQDSTNS